MRFDFTEEQLLIQQTAREFAEAEIAPSAVQRDIDGTFPTEIVAKLAELGFLGMMVDPEYGGAGLDTMSYVLAMEEISKVDASVGVIMSVNNSLVTYGLQKHGTEEQKRTYLVPLAQGEKIGAFCLSEPEAGSDATSQRTEAVPTENGWAITGTKNWITNGSSASVYLVIAQTNRELRHKGITCFIVEKGAPGFDIGKKEDKLGIRSSDTTSLHFSNTPAGHDQVLWEVGKGFNFAMETLNGGRIGIAAQALGIAAASYEAARKYSKERKAFGAPISEFQAIQFKLADMNTQLEAARLLTYRAAALKDAHKPYAREAAMAKLYASRVAVHNALEAIQIHGGYGYVREYLVERYLRDAKITEIYEGTSEVQHIVIARDLLKD